jgi:pimeloyl-ACP methyl ester carboxylesterase
MPRVLMLPGFGGGADQPILVALESALGPLGLSGRRASLPRGRPLPGLVREVESARGLLRADPDIAGYVGRSFGGRVLARLALLEPPRALVLLGFPIRSMNGTRRREDEDVLEQLQCPTLIVQGSADPLGPVATLRALTRKNAHLELAVLPGATHSFGRRQKQAVSFAAAWLAQRLG